MKAVILASGKGTRMGEISDHTPKPQVKILGKTLLEHKLDELPDEITEVIIVVGHLKEKIMDHLGSEYMGRKIKYIEQTELSGTAPALRLCKSELENEARFLVMTGDDIFIKEDMRECMQYDFSMLLAHTDSMKGRVKINFDKEGYITDIVEKYPIDEPGLMCAGMYTLTPAFFDYPMTSIASGELGLPHTMFSIANKVKIKAVEARFWLQITRPEDIALAEEVLQNHQKSVQ